MRESNFSENIAGTSILSQFPKGTRVLSYEPLRGSLWASTSKLHIQYPSGKEELLFLKVVAGNNADKIIRGEFVSMTELNKWMPQLGPKPHSYGKCSHKPSESWFLLLDYVDMFSEMPSPAELCKKLTDLHQVSQSPTGAFGFHTTTCQGRTTQHTAWESNWTVFFTRLIQHVMKLDIESNGEWEELDILGRALVAKVVPRLLDALVANGRALKPCFIHGDLWEGNTGISKSRGTVYIFDAAGFYAHNEMETGNWRCYYNNISDPIYTKTYLEYFPPSEPSAEWEDRNRLYSIYYNLLFSVNHLESGNAIRQQAYNDMYYLIDRYAPFMDGAGPPRLCLSDMIELPAERNHSGKSEQEHFLKKQLST